LPDHVSSYSMGDVDALDWRFDLGEEIMAWMLVKCGYGLNEMHSPEHSVKLDVMATEQQNIARLFTVFAGYFVRHYSK